ncbi:hypothetical protein SynSYN20_01557 [Synechococcus sp. SYN20]|nr:hypothetical protein SynSYN20_01557 [Synechococcus sp. SYN20]
MKSSSSVTSRSSVTRESSLGDEQVSTEVTTESSTDKKAFKKPPSEEKKAPTPSLKEELISAWNSHKPKVWPTMKGISPSRERSIKALGGYREVIDLLPSSLAGAKATRFWNSKPMTWENLIGSGTTPKGHLHSLAEVVPSAGLGSNSNNAPYPVEHEDFFAPDPKTGDMRPKHGFASPEDRKAAEESARAFYTQLQEG